MHNFLKWLNVILCCLLIAACMPARGIREEFNKNAKEYNRLIRWKEIENAGSLFVVPEGREQYMADAKSIKKRDVMITDYRILSMEFIDEQRRGDVVVEFDYYTLPSNRIKTLTYKQDWVYSEAKSWKVKSPLPAFE